MQNIKINTTSKIKPHQFVIIFLTSVITIIKRNSQTWWHISCVLNATTKLHGMEPTSYGMAFAYNESFVRFVEKTTQFKNDVYLTELEVSQISSLIDFATSKWAAYSAHWWSCPHNTHFFWKYRNVISQQNKCQKDPQCVRYNVLQNYSGMNTLITKICDLDSIERSVRSNFLYIFWIT